MNKKLLFIFLFLLLLSASVMLTFHTLKGREIVFLNNTIKVPSNAIFIEIGRDEQNRICGEMVSLFDRERLNEAPAPPVPLRISSGPVTIAPSTESGAIRMIKETFHEREQ